MADELLTEALDALERVGCQFQFCDGPTLQPVDMATCYVCEIVARLRVAAGRPARAETDETSLETIERREDEYLARCIPDYQPRAKRMGATPAEDDHRG